MSKRPRCGVAPEVGGRLIEVAVKEGDRIEAGASWRGSMTRTRPSQIERAQAERDQAVAQLRLLQAGARAEDIRQARAQVESAQAEVAAAEAELQSARDDLARFEALLASNAGSRKQRDDAATNVAVADARVTARASGYARQLKRWGRLRAGARAEEIAAARARVAATEAQIAALAKAQADATLKSPVAGFVTAKLVDAGEVIARGTPVVVVTDLDHAWANVYVDEPLVPRLKLGQKISLVTDAGQRLEGTIYLHLAQGGVHAAQRADRRGTHQARVPHQGHRRQPRRRAEVGHAGRGGDPAMSDEAITFERVTKVYGQLRALDDLSLAIRRGEMFGLIGPDGAGKTTAIRLACGLLGPDSGVVKVLGRSPTKEHRAITAAVGYLSQRFCLYGDLTIDENIAFFAEIHGVRAIRRSAIDCSR